MGRIRDLRRALRRTWKHKPGVWPWIMSLPTRSMVALLSLLPSPLTLAFADRVARLAWLSARRRKYGRAQLQLALPHLSEAERDQILKRSCGHLGRSVAETMIVLQRARRDGLEGLIEFEKGAKQQLLAVQDQGAVLVQAHLGGFEVFGAAAVQTELRPAFTMRMPTNYYVGQKLLKSRDGWGIELIPRQGAVRRMLTHMKSGGAVILATDQNAQRAPLFVPWFGKLAATERAAAAIALRTGAPVLVGWCLRTNRIGKYRVGVTTLRSKCDKQAATDEAVFALTGQMHHKLEAVIRQHPEQYLWIHDRYRTRPPKDD
ncbi:MAG: hypothetical protein HQ519_02730 [Planctomycetes bacterium]|nr:hypothetical protein [Planctomycetota bacterium]